MTIEFHCSSCDRLLRTTDDKAGVTAPCPGCGALLTVPAPAAEATREEPVEDYPLQSAPVARSRASAEGAETTLCPMCGATAPIQSFHCPACGESLVPDNDAATGRPTRIDAGDMFRRTWEIYKAQLGTTIGGVFLAMFLNQVLSFPWNAIASNPQAPGPAKLLFLLIAMAGNVYFQIGQIILLVKVASGTNARPRNIFMGRPYFWRFLGAGILFALILIPAFLLLFVPGLFLFLMLWPVFYVLVAENRPVMESFRRARELTRGNRLSMFLLYLALIGIHVPIFIILFVGLGVFVPLGLLLLLSYLVFAIPGILLLFAVTYTAMSGRPTAEQLAAIRSTV